MSLSHLPRWRRLPRELQLVVLKLAGVESSLLFADLEAVRDGLELDFAVSDIATQRTWWLAAFQTNWLEGARLLVDSFVPFLPVLDDDVNHPITVSADVVELLFASDIVFTRNLPDSRDVNTKVADMHWTAINVLTLFELVRRLCPNDDPRRRDMIKEIWLTAPPYIRLNCLCRLLRHSDTVSLDHLPDVAPWFNDCLGTVLEAAGQQHAVSVLKWARDKLGVSLDPVRLANTAITCGNREVVAWVWDSLTAEQLAKVDPVTTAIKHGRFDILEWLRDRMGGVCCSQHCPCTTAAGLPIPTQKVLQSITSLQTIQWLHRHHPHALHPELFTCSRPALYKTFFGGHIEVLRFLSQHYPDALAGVDKSRVEMYIIEQGDHVEILDWFDEQFHDEEVYYSAPVGCCIAPRIALWKFQRQRAHQARDRPFTGAKLALQYIGIRTQQVRDGPARFASRTLFDLLMQHYMLFLDPRFDRFRPELARYFLGCAMASNDHNWAKEVMSRYDPLLDGHDHLLALYRPDHWPLLRRLAEDGHLKDPLIPVWCIDNDNLFGALWLLVRYEIPEMDIAVEACLEGGHLGLLQVIHDNDRVCHQCVIEAADTHQQPHILAWSQCQPGESWVMCEQHHNA